MRELVHPHTIYVEPPTQKPALTFSHPLLDVAPAFDIARLIYSLSALHKERTLAAIHSLEYKYFEERTLPPPPSSSNSSYSYDIHASTLEGHAERVP